MTNHGHQLPKPTGIDTERVEAVWRGMAGGFGYECGRCSVAVARTERILLPAMRSAAAVLVRSSQVAGWKEELRKSGGRLLVAALGVLVLSGCEGRQSALAPAGKEASRIADLFWGMTIGGALIWLFVVAVALYAAYFAREPQETRKARTLIIGGGVLFPTLVLAGLLAYSLSMLRELLAPAPEGSLKIHVTGYQWWWRVRYLREGAPPVELANELHLPVGVPVAFQLDTPDVIHSFWIPSLGGKMDMIPGRNTRLLLHPTKTGTYRGACAEYCGTSHAWMGFMVVVQEPAEFERWLDQQAAPAALPVGAQTAHGRELFIENGCGACHALRGTAADGGVGPDLTHVGGRLTIGAGLFDTSAESLQRWLATTGEVKPGVHMPAFGMLPAGEQRALSTYLESLK